MDVQLSPDKEARLQDFASRTGRDAAQLVIEAVDRKAAPQPVEASCLNMAR
jgi:predicted DNA-binding protein